MATEQDRFYFHALGEVIGDLFGEGVTVRPLARGDRGDDVYAVQQQLAQAGFSAGGEAGDFGPRTEGAVASFQNSRGLTSDGTVNYSTLAALGLGAPALHSGTEPSQGTAKAARLVRIAEEAVRVASEAMDDAMSPAQLQLAQARALDAAAKAQIALKAAKRSGGVAERGAAEEVLRAARELLPHPLRGTPILGYAGGAGGFLSREYVGIPLWGWGALGAIAVALCKVFGIGFRR